MSGLADIQESNSTEYQDVELFLSKRPDYGGVTRKSTVNVLRLPNFLFVENLAPSESKDSLKSKFFIKHMNGQTNCRIVQWSDKSVSVIVCADVFEASMDSVGERFYLVLLLAMCIL
jgi:hypothetical protein